MRLSNHDGDVTFTEVDYERMGREAEGNLLRRVLKRVWSKVKEIVKLDR